MSYTLRRYHAGHGERLAQFVLPIAGRTYANWVDSDLAHSWASSEHGAESWDLRLADPATHVLAVERTDTSIAACAFVRIRRETAYLGGLYVEDVKRGLGGLLREERLRIGGESGARNAVMMIRATNGPARVIAEKAGFVHVGEFPCERLSTVPRLVYAMELRSPSRAFRCRDVHLGVAPVHSAVVA